LRPVSIKGQRQVQMESIGERQSFAKNYLDSESLRVELLSLLEDLSLWSSVVMRRPGGEISVQISKKGKAIVHHHKGGKEDARALALVYVEPLPHNRVKSVPVSPDTSHPFLIKLGMQTPEGKIKAGSQDKFRQVNDFLKLLSRGPGSYFDGLATGSEPLRLLDCGCGSSHLTFGAYHYVKNVLGKEVQIRGIDTNAALMAKSNDLARELGLSTDEAMFINTPIGSYTPEGNTPHIVVALHACDTATDDSLAFAVRYKVPIVMSSPCCLKDLHQKIQKKGLAPPLHLAPILSHGIMRQRYYDMITDSLRAQLLSLFGYKADIVEFVDSSHTPRNLMIRAIKREEPMDKASLAVLLSEYDALKSFAGGAEPHLETLLRQELSTIRAQLADNDQLSD
jgi:SAM-dependent methyltransferase